MSIDEEQQPCHAHYSSSPSPAATPSTASSLNTTPEKSILAASESSGYESPLEVLSRAASMVESVPVSDENKSNNEVNGECAVLYNSVVYICRAEAINPLRGKTKECC